MAAAFSGKTWARPKRVEAGGVLSVSMRLGVTPIRDGSWRAGGGAEVTNRHSLVTRSAPPPVETLELTNSRPSCAQGESGSYWAQMSWSESPLTGRSEQDAGIACQRATQDVTNPVVFAPRLRPSVRGPGQSSMWGCELDGSQSAQPKRSTALRGAAHRIRPTERA